MTDETVECFNCGASNPEWAQVCRSCGVALRHGETRVVSSERIPTVRDSLISIAAVIGTILVALLVGLFIAGLNPTQPTVGRATPTPSPTVTPTVEPTATPIATDTPAPTPSPTPALPGTVTFGTALAGDGTIAEPTDTFTPSANMAYSISMPGTFGASQFENEVVRADGSEVVLPREAINVDPSATVFGYTIGNAASLISAWGPGEYVWQVYVNDAVVARGTFRFAEG
jgi:hypothetical protein